MLQTVLDHESYLFTAPELATFDKYRALSCRSTRFCSDQTRLILIGLITLAR
jgi:hypothetical protein